MSRQADKEGEAIYEEKNSYFSFAHDYEDFCPRPLGNCESSVSYCHSVAIQWQHFGLSATTKSGLQKGFRAFGDNSGRFFQETFSF